jgi:hypothetical protein
MRKMVNQYHNPFYLSEFIFVFKNILKKIALKYIIFIFNINIYALSNSFILYQYLIRD